MTGVPSRRELLAWFIAFAMVMTFAVSLATSPAAGSYADDGKTTGAEESAPVPEIPPIGTPQTVYVATGLNFPDALGAAGAAGVAMGPVLLVAQNSIPPETLAELNRLAPTRIVIVGGTAVISNTVELALQGLSFGPTVDRIAGANRYDTAAQLSQDMHWTRGFMPRMAWDDAVNTIVGNNTDQVVLTIPHTTDKPGVYMLWGSAELFGGPDTLITCRLKADGVNITATRRDVELDNAANSEENCSTQGWFFAPAGTRTFTMTINAAAGVSIWERNLLLYWNAYYPGS